MALYTFLISEYFKEVIAEQYEAVSESQAMLQWAEELDFQRYGVKNIYAYNEFYKDTLEFGLPPTPLNTLTEAWFSSSIIQARHILMEIIKTTDSEPAYKSCNNLFTIVYYALGGSNISQLKNVKHIDQVIPLWLEEKGEQDIHKYTPPLTKREKAELISIIRDVKLAKHNELINVWSAKFSFMGKLIELYAVPTVK